MNSIHYTAYEKLLPQVQEYLSKSYPSALLDRERFDEVKEHIRHYLYTNKHFIQGMTTDELNDRLYFDMCEYGFLTPYLSMPEVEEININAWDDVAAHYVDGSVRKIEHFYDPEHAKNIIVRLLNHSGMTIDGAMPLAQGHLPNNARITVMSNPVIDKVRMLAVSIRLLHPTTADIPWLLELDTATTEMLEFLVMCMRYGVSCVIAGAPMSGKTTTLNALLKAIPNNKRIMTIESGSRELSLVKRDSEGNVINNVVHTLSRPAENARENITQEDLVVYSLRFNPSNLIIGEMRDTEAYAAIDAALTGNTVASTIHSFYAADAHLRLGSLCLRRHEMNLDVAQMLAAKAFPVVAYQQLLENNERKIMNISECVVTSEGKREYHTLYRYVVEDNSSSSGKVTTVGHFEKVENMSKSLQERLTTFGAPKALIRRFLGGGEVK